MHKLILVHVEVTILKVFLLFFSLNNEKSKSQSTGIKESGSEGDINRKKLRFLIVDDHAGFRKAMSVQLKTICDELRYDALIEDVKSGNLAIKKVDGGSSYDFIFFDVQMPGMTGIDACQELKSVNTETRAVLISTDEKYRDNAENLGVEFLDKNDSDLKNKLIKMLREA